YLRLFLQMGYRHVDTASGYHDEVLLREALEDALRIQNCLSFWQSSALGFVYLFITHRPLGLKKGSKVPLTEISILPFEMRSTRATLEYCVQQGFTKCVGVGNFSVSSLQELIFFAQLPPAVNQESIPSRTI
ncbi:NADPH-dependent codeinone reductase 1-2-like, partial [Physcomitrium patens]|uniref:NADPH-dependent codeinone reductase 1-2-like n=1 Tax=Physcomitrium patens TaxID=3218 RepID=UPI003CCDAAF2